MPNKKSTVSAAATIDAPKGTDKKAAPQNARTCKAYKKAARALVDRIATLVVSAVNSTDELCSALADGFAMDLHTVTGHDDNTKWALSLIADCAPECGTSTAYRWVERAHGLIGLRRAKVDPSTWHTDAIGFVGSKASGRAQDPTRMADLAKEIDGNESLRNKSGKIDAKKVREHVCGKKSGGSTPDDYADAVAELARKYGKGKKGALQLLAAATIIAQNWTEEASK